jgi:hypothetical protein
MDSVVSFKIDSYAHIGNPYAYKHAAETSIYLSEGSHKLYVCTTYDVRIYGNSLPPKLVFSGSIRSVELIDPHHGMIAYLDDTVLPEIMDGRLVSPYASVVIRNGPVPPLDRIPRDVDFNNQWKMVDKIFVTDMEGNEVIES